MSAESIYKSIEPAKNGSLIPVFQSGRTMESRYNPERDADNLCASIEKGNFFVVTGLGSGLFINKLYEKIPDSKILVVENSPADFDFLLQLESVKKIQANQNIVFCAIDELFTKLIENYLPGKYGDLQIIEQRGWVNENQTASAQIKEILKRAVSIISADYSVQAHFGRLWTHNILSNLRLIGKTSEHNNEIDKLHEQAAAGKTAIIVAAGPTLDSQINLIKEEHNQNKTYIIATDTAWSTLEANDICADAVVSIDGQSVSYNHFMHKSTGKPVFFFDLCSNTSAAQHVISRELGTPVFFCSGHPLATALKNFSGGALPFLFSGSGTVTISALDLAVKAGFKKIKIIGADFSYSNGKAYTKGTYLDALYNKASNKTNSSEQTFSKLLYRTELTDLSDGHKTTAVLEAYRTSLENYLAENGITFTRKDYIYELDASNCQPQKIVYEPSKINHKAFMTELAKASPQEIETILLPYVAYLRNTKKYQNCEYNELLNLAFSRIVSYNI